MPTSDQYEYEPLSTPEAVRLILLDPALHHDDPLRCLIIERPRPIKVAGYSAVSYAWGKPEFTHDLGIRSAGGTSYLRITPNVDTLLRHLRAPKSKVCLWIDAICLNQKDKVEKAQQVPLMGRIYGEAEEVHIWLGAEDQGTARTFAFFRHASQIPELTRLLEAELMVLHMLECIEQTPSVALAVIYNFFDRPWFSRRWIVQEACLAREAIVHCGSHTLPLPTIAAAAGRFRSLVNSSYEINMITKLRRPKTDMAILELLWYFHEADCVDPKDRVAAFLGLMPEGMASRLQYSAHWLEMYKQLATLILELGCNDDRLQLMLHLFEFGPVSIPEDSSIPSWVPNWSTSRLRSLPYQSCIMSEDIYESMPASPGKFDVSTLSFQNGNLKISWDSSLCGPRGRRATFVTEHNPQPSTMTETTRARELFNILNRLFPSPTGSASEIIALCSLLETVANLDYGALEYVQDVAYFDDHVNDNCRKLSKALKAAYFHSVRSLDVILREFSLLRLETFEDGSNISKAYGIGPQEVKYSDIMVPLWTLNWEPDGHHQILEDEGMVAHMSTMLAVRPVGSHSSQPVGITLNEQEPTLKATIIGPVVCVLIENINHRENEGFGKLKTRRRSGNGTHCVILG